MRVGAQAHAFTHVSAYASLSLKSVCLCVATQAVLQGEGSQFSMLARLYLLAKGTPFR